MLWFIAKRSDEDHIYSISLGECWGPKLLNNFVNDLDDKTKHTLSKFADIIKLGWVIFKSETSVQSHLNKYLMKFIKGKCHAVLLGRNNIMHQYKISLFSWKTALWKKIWSPDGQQVEHEFEMCLCGRCQQGWIRKSNISKSKEVILSFFSLNGTNRKCCNQFWAPHVMDILERVQQRVTKQLRGWNNWHARRDWERWDCLAWRRKDLRCINSWWRGSKNVTRCFSV